MHSFGPAGQLQADPLVSGPSPAGRAPRLGTILLFSVFALLGICGAVALVPMVSRFNGLLVGALVVIGPLVFGLTFYGLWTAFVKFRAFRKQLKWWHWLWFLLLASGFVFRVREISSAKENPVDSAALYRLGLVGFTALLLIGRLLRRKSAWLRPLFQGLIGAMTAFALACAASSIWSVNPPWTLYKSLEYLVDLVLLAAILVTLRSVRDYQNLFNWNWVLTGLLIASAYVGAVIWPEEAWEAGYGGGMLGVRLSGVYPGQGWNRLGDLGAILGVVAIARLMPLNRRKQDRLWYLVLLGLGILTIVLSQTRSALLGLTVGTLMVMAFTGRLKRGALLALGFLGLVAMSGAGSFLMTFLERGQSQEEMVSLSSRVSWWSMGWQLLSQHPWTGLGAFAAGPFGVFEKLGMANVGPLHSDYVETLVGTSFWGLIPLLIALFGTWWVLVRWTRDKKAPLLDRQLAMEATAVLGVITIRSVFMTFIVMHPPLNFLVILGYAESLRRRSQRAAQKQALTQKMIAA